MKIEISLIVLMLIIISLPIAISDSPSDFTMTILSGQSTSLTSLNTNFGALVAGSENNQILNSFSLINAGNNDASVNITFTTYNTSSGIYGMTNDTYDAIGGSNFSMNLTGQTAVNLDNTASDTAFGSGHNVVADNVTDMWNVYLDAPAGKSAAIYSGLIQLTFADA